MSFNHAEKISEKEKPESTQYTCHRYNYRNESPLDALKSRFYHLPYYIFVSVDPAINNLGFYIEKRYNTGYVETLVIDKAKFKAETDPNTNSSLYLEVMMFLDKYKDYYTECHFIIIERQFKYQSARVMQQVISYFMTIARTLINEPFIIEMDSKVRLKQMKCPAGLNRPYQKKWIVEKCYYILRQRNDQRALVFLDGMATKKDDVADAIVQVEAFCILTELLPITREVPVGSTIKSAYRGTGHSLPPIAYSTPYLTQYPTNNNFVIVMEDEISYFS